MQEKIISICETLTAQGIKPTLESVRKELGGGSFSTINPILKQWKESKTAKLVQVVAAPPEALKAAEQAAALIWSIATEHQAEAINAITAEATRIEQTALADRDEALAEIQALEARLKDLESKHSELQTTCDALAVENTDKYKIIGQLQQEAEKQQIRLENATQTAEKAEGEIKVLREQNASQADAMNALKLEIATQKLSIEAITKTGINLEKETEQLKSEIKKAAADAKNQAKEINSLSLQNQKLQTVLDSTAKSLGEAKVEVKELRQELKQAQNEAAKLEGMLAERKSAAN